VFLLVVLTDKIKSNNSEAYVLEYNDDVSGVDDDDGDKSSVDLLKLLLLTQVR
jgi:hypothetical protein